MGVSKKKDRLGEEKLNKQGYLMKIVEYNNANNMLVEFDDELKTKAYGKWQQFENGSFVNPITYNNRLGEERYNKNNCLMKIVEYNNANDIIVEFQDEYKGRVHTSYQAFSIGAIKNPYYSDVFGVGIVGNKYPTKINNKHLKEYKAWHGMIQRCYNEKYKIKRPTYQDVTCCREWLLYENFYEWLHEQENFEKWLNGKMWAVDKDILVKGNKIYSPETCCLVPNSINGLFLKCNSARGNLPIGISKKYKGYAVYCQNPFTKENDYLGSYSTLENSFRVYKGYKEKIIKQVAQEEYDKGNITKQCYNAMMNYEVEITD